MPDYPADWRRALELLASLQEGSTEALLFAHGFGATTIAGLVDSGLATSTTEKVWAGGRTVNVKRVRITPAGRVALMRRRTGE
jgi:hypothetical protein